MWATLIPKESGFQEALGLLNQRKLIGFSKLWPAWEAAGRQQLSWHAQGNS